MEFSAIFIGEGSSDAPLADIVEALFRDRGHSLRITVPDFALLEERVSKALTSRLTAAHRLMAEAAAEIDLVILHRDVDNTDHAKRLDEMVSALDSSPFQGHLVPVIPVKETEAWLLIDEQAIRHVAGNPRGSVDLQLPKTASVESVSDPKAALRDALLSAGDVRGRRRQQLAKRFASNRRLLLQRLDHTGAVCELPSFKRLVESVDAVAAKWSESSA